jgi:hypothetical protein
MMPIRTWSCRDEGDEVRHMGSTAQDFRTAFGPGVTDHAISTVDADDVAPAAIQALQARTSTLRRENRDLSVELATMRREHHEMTERLARVVAALAAMTSSR